MNPACLVCGAEAAELWASAVDTEYLTTPDRFDLWHCPGCDCLSIDPVPADRLAEIYPPEYYSFAAGRDELGRVARAGAAVKSRLDRRTFRRVLALAGTDTPSILDVGGGTGEFSIPLVAAGAPGTRATVLDIDPRSAELARSRGLEAVVSRFEDFETTERFDLILMLNLIEHVADPVAMLAKARELLVPSGVVWIQTPDFHGLDARIFRHRNWAGYHCPRHWAIFGRDGLERALSGAGLAPISIKGTQAGAFWAASLLGLRRARRLPANGRPLVQSPLFGPLAAVAAGFDLVTSPLRRTSQLVCLARPA